MTAEDFLCLIPRDDRHLEGQAPIVLRYVGITILILFTLVFLTSDTPAGTSSQDVPLGTSADFGCYYVRSNELISSRYRSVKLLLSYIQHERMSSRFLGKITLEQ